MTRSQIKKELEENRKHHENYTSHLGKSREFNLEQPGYIIKDKKSISLDQESITNLVSQQAKENKYVINLEIGKYNVRYDDSGRFLSVYEENGYFSMIDAKTRHLFFENNVNEKIHDVKFLHNELYIAVAQKKNLFIYDNMGREIHCVRKNKNVVKMDFLPYHLLLSSVTYDGVLRYLDTTMGKIVSENQTSVKPTCLTKDSTTGIVFIGDKEGCVSLHTPNDKTFVAKILCHQSQVSNLVCERFGNFFVTNGFDNKVNIYDLRNTFKPLNSIESKENYSCLALSQTNKLAVSYKNRVEIFENICGKQTNFYTERFDNKIIHSMEFCNHEDILTIGSSKGFENLIIPGAGDPNFDTYENSPFRSKKQRQESEIKRFLEKVPYQMIVYNKVDN